MYQTTALFQKNSGFLEWEAVLTNNVNRLISLKQYQKALTRGSTYFH